MPPQFLDGLLPLSCVQAHRLIIILYYCTSYAILSQRNQSKRLHFYYTWLFINKSLKMMRKHSVEGFNKFKDFLMRENFCIFKKVCQITILSVSL